MTEWNTTKNKMPLATYLVPSAIFFGCFLVVPAFYNYYVTTDGEYGPWSDWSKCLQTCGDSYQGRYRDCVKSHRGFGKSCKDLAPRVELQHCKIIDCPVDGAIGPWGPWSAKCNIDCKAGRLRRDRKCDNPTTMYYGRGCVEHLVEFKQCPSKKECPVHGKYLQWGPYSACTVTCGGGTKQRNRTCIPPKYEGKPCSDKGKPVDTRRCNENPCPVDGKFSEWAAWSACSKTCGEGQHSRERRCTPPRHGGKPCNGPSKESGKCNVKPCNPVTTKKPVTAKKP